MRKTIREIDNNKILKTLKIDCEKCFGFCCVALYFSKTEGFPNDKKAGTPCVNLKADFTCSDHKNLRKKGLKGCTAYDCFGAGQKVAQSTFNGKNWREFKELQNQMFEVFLVMRQLHEMLWYLGDALTFVSNKNMKDQLSIRIQEIDQLTKLDAHSIMSIDIEKYRTKVNSILRMANEIAKDKIAKYKINNSKNKKNLKLGYDFIGTNLTDTNLIGANFAGALLIAANMKNTDLKGANLIGADLRDADIRGANLEDAIFLTQSQINTAKGDYKTRLPKSLARPAYWESEK